MPIRKVAEAWNAAKVGLRRFVRNHAAPLSAAGISLAAALVYFRDWLLAPGVPLDGTGDALQKLTILVGAMRHGWILENASVGLPEIGRAFDFPRFDSLNYVVLKILTWVLRDPFLAANVFHVSGYPLIAASAAWVLVKMGVTRSSSVVCAVGYAWMPYHQLPGFAHFTNSFYPLVPLALWLVWSTWHVREMDPGRPRRWIGAALLVAALELQNVYYGLFFGVIASTYALLLGALRGFRASRRPLLHTGFLLLVLGVTFVLEQLPRIVFEARNGKNVLGLVRLPNAPSEFALTLADLVNPSPDHPIVPIAEWSQAAAALRGLELSERVFASLPTFGLVGFVVALSALVLRAFRGPAADRAAHVPEWAGATIAVALLWAHQGALCTLVSEFGFSAVRAWNRMSIVVAFGAFAALGAWLDIRTKSLRQRTKLALLGVIAALLLAEQLFTVHRVPFGVTAARFHDSKTFVTSLVADGQEHRAFVLPFVDYPESGARGRIQDYDHFILGLHSERLKLNYGSMRGRGAHYFSDAASLLDPQELIGYLVRGGFDTIIVDTYGDKIAEIDAALAMILGPLPAKSARYVGYRLPEPDESNVHEGWRDYELGTELDFASDPTVRRYLDLNFSGFEEGGTWTLGQKAAIRLRAPFPHESLVLMVAGETHEPHGESQRVRVLFDGREICTISRANAEGGAPRRWTCPFQQNASDQVITDHRIVFEVAYPTMPKERGEGLDARRIGLRLARLRLDPAQGE